MFVEINNLCFFATCFKRHTNSERDNEMTKHGGNPKPSRKTCYSKETVGYNLATGQRRQFRSMRRAALDLGLSIAAVQDFIGRRPFRGWLFFLLDEENTKKCQDSLRYWKENFDKDCRYIGEDAPMPARKTPTNTNKVPLRIDARTVIYVAPEKATPEYAESYREKMEKAKTKDL